LKNRNFESIKRIELKNVKVFFSNSCLQSFASNFNWKTILKSTRKFLKFYFHVEIGLDNLNLCYGMLKIFNWGFYEVCVWLLGSFRFSSFGQFSNEVLGFLENYG